MWRPVELKAARREGPRWPHLALTVLCAWLYLPGIVSLPPLDRDESRYVQATRQMMESGDFVSIRFQDEPRNKKPAGIYWLQALSVGLLSDPARSEVWPYRVPSFLGAWLAVLLTYRIGRERLGPTEGLVAASLLAASLGLVAEAVQAKTDAVLLATVVVTQVALARAYLAAADPAAPAVGWASVLAFWLGLGVGLLVKGPVGPAVTALTTLTLVAVRRDARWLSALRPLPGTLLLLAVVLPWSIAIGLSTGSGFFRESLGEDLFPKLVSGQESHGAPPGYFLATGLATFWPGSLLLAPAVVLAWRRRREPFVTFCLAWVVPFWALIELVPTKLPHYLLPLFPALALLVAGAVRELKGPGLLEKAYLALWLLVLLAVTAALVGLPQVLAVGVSASTVGLAGVLAATSGAAAFLSLHGRPAAGIGAGLLGSVVVAPWLTALYLPGITPLWLSAQTARALQEAGPAPETVAVTGYSEPSLVFLLGTQTRFTSPEEAALSLAQGAGRVAIVSESRREPFLSALANRSTRAVEVATLTGMNYSKGRWTTLHVYRRLP